MEKLFHKSFKLGFFFLEIFLLNNKWAVNLSLHSKKWN